MASNPTLLPGQPAQARAEEASAWNALLGHDLRPILGPVTPQDVARITQVRETLSRERELVDSDVFSHLTFPTPNLRSGALSEPVPPGGRAYLDASPLGDDLVQQRGIQDDIDEHSLNVDLLGLDGQSIHDNHRDGEDHPTTYQYVNTFSSPDEAMQGIQPPLPGEMAYRFGPSSVHSPLAFLAPSIVPAVTLTAASPQSSSMTSPTAGATSSLQTQTVDPARLSQPSGIFMPTPTPSRPVTPPVDDASSPSLSGPILGLTSDLLRLNHSVRAHELGTGDLYSPAPPNSEQWPVEGDGREIHPDDTMHEDVEPRDPQREDVGPRGGQDTEAQGAEPQNTEAQGAEPQNTVRKPMAAPSLSDGLLEGHRALLMRTLDRGVLKGLIGTYEDSNAASDFIIEHPSASLLKHIDALFSKTWLALVLSGAYKETTMSHEEIRADVAGRVAVLIANDRSVRGTIFDGKKRIGAFLADAFRYAFDVLLKKKDSGLLAIREEASPSHAVKRINLIASTMAYAHLPVYVPYSDNPAPITPQSHPEVADFPQTTSVASGLRAVTLLHRHTAFTRLAGFRDLVAEIPGFDWTPNDTQALLLDNPPVTRFGPDTPFLLRVISGEEEAYFLNCQAPVLLFQTRFHVDNIHGRSLLDGGSPSVVARFLDNQNRVAAGSPEDSVWRVLIAPIAMCAAALYCARENIVAYMEGSITAEAAMNATPDIALIFQAKILSAEKVLALWVASESSRVEYPLLRARLLAIIADVIKPGDDFIGYDLSGPLFATAESDHLAYQQSLTSRNNDFVAPSEPVLTRAASILETSYLADARSQGSVLALLREL